VYSSATIKVSDRKVHLNSTPWKSLLYIACAFVLGIVVGVWWPRSTPQPDETKLLRSESATTKIPPNQAVVGFMDMIDGKPAVSVPPNGNPQISGWAACVNASSTPADINILIDKDPVAATKISFSRPDVAKAYGRPDFEKSGWKVLVPTAGIKAGDHELTARVTCSGGEKGVLPSFRLLVSGQ